MATSLVAYLLRYTFKWTTVGGKIKKRFVLCFLAVLIEMGIFTKIKISFLMVGHTHEDIDQMFSCISRRLSKNNARTLVELIREIGLSYTPVIEVDILTYMYDVRRWLEECIVPNLSGHIHQHQFKLVKGPDGKALLFYKKWSTSPAWQPAQGLHIVNGRPKGVPELIDQDKSHMNFAKMAQDLPKYRLHFDSDTTRWWERFIENEGPEESRPKWILPLLEAQQPPPLEAGVGCDPGINEGLLSLVEREEREVEVTVGRKRKTSAKQGQRKKETWKT